MVEKRVVWHNFEAKTMEKPVVLNHFEAKTVKSTWF